jgi:hypothetical protein
LSRPSNRYTYENAGFNGFMTRSLKSNPNAQTLADGPSSSASNTVNFDMMNTSGMITDGLRVGAQLELQGSKGRLAVKDLRGTEVGWVGSLDT